MTAKAGRIELKLAEATALGGNVTGNLQLDRNAGGVTAKTAFRLSKTRLEAFAAPGAKPAASGEMTVNLDLEGSGLSPRHLISALRGKGEMIITDGRLDRLSPKSLRTTVEAMLALKGEIPQDELARRLVTVFTIGPIGNQVSSPASSSPANSTASNTVTIGKRTLGLQVAEGSVRFTPLEIETQDGRLTGTTVMAIEEPKFTLSSRDGAFEIRVAARSRAGNWLPTAGIERYALMLRLYDTPVGVATRTQRDAPMPSIATAGCP